MKTECNPLNCAKRALVRCTEWETFRIKPTFNAIILGIVPAPVFLHVFAFRPKR
jgi:hypothetical protein